MLAPNAEEEAGDEAEDFTERCLPEVMVLIAKSKYRSLARIFPTNIVVMRLLCRAKLILTPNRRRMDRSTLEMLLLYTFPLQQGYVGPLNS